MLGQSQKQPRVTNPLVKETFFFRLEHGEGLYLDVKQTKMAVCTLATCQMLPSAMQLPQVGFTDFAVGGTEDKQGPPVLEFSLKVYNSQEATQEATGHQVQGPQVQGLPAESSGLPDKASAPPGLAAAAVKMPASQPAQDPTVTSAAPVAGPRAGGSCSNVEGLIWTPELQEIPAEQQAKLITMFTVREDLKKWVHHELVERLKKNEVPYLGETPSINWLAFGWSYSRNEYPTETQLYQPAHIYPYELYYLADSIIAGIDAVMQVPGLQSKVTEVNKEVILGLTMAKAWCTHARQGQLVWGPLIADALVRGATLGPAAGDGSDYLPKAVNGQPWNYPYHAAAYLSLLREYLLALGAWVKPVDRRCNVEEVPGLNVHPDQGRMEANTKVADDAFCRVWGFEKMQFFGGTSLLMLQPGVIGRQLFTTSTKPATFMNPGALGLRTKKLSWWVSLTGKMHPR